MSANAIERLRAALPPADHDPPCGVGRCAPHSDLAAVEALLEDVKEAIKDLVRLDTHAAESQHSQSIRRAREEEKAIALRVRLALAAAVRRVETGQ